MTKRQNNFKKLSQVGDSHSSCVCDGNYRRKIFISFFSSCCYDPFKLAASALLNAIA